MRNSWDRLDQLQLKVIRAILDPLGLSVAVDILPDQRSDDRLYLPIIARVCTSLGQRGLLYGGDDKLGTFGTCAHLHHVGDHYLCPLGCVQLTSMQLASLMEQALAPRPWRPSIALRLMVCYCVWLGIRPNHLGK